MKTAPTLSSPPIWKILVKGEHPVLTDLLVTDGKNCMVAEFDGRWWIKGEDGQICYFIDETSMEPANLTHYMTMPSLPQ